MRISRRALLAISSVLTFGVAAGAAVPAEAQAWPEKPVTLINPFPAGGGTDTFARPLSAELTKQLGQSFIVDNKGGAGGTLGAGVAARAAKDGYTFFVGAVHHTIAPSVYAKLTYDLEKDFEPIAVIAMVPHIVSVNPTKIQAKTLKEFIAYLKANPGKVSFGSAGNGTSHHLAGEMFKGLTGTDILHVPYKGAGPMMQDLLGGQIDMAFDGLGTSSAQIKAGKLVGLALAAPKRSDALPDVPTAAEAGVPGYEAAAWYGVWAVAGTPKPIKDKMAAEIAKALKTENIVKVWAGQGAVTGPAGADMVAFVKSQIESWGKVAKAANVKID